MVKDEFRPDVGKKIFVQHQAELEQGLQQLVYALGSSQKLSRPAEFFQAFISGFWDPFQEACEVGNQQQTEITEKIRSLESQLRQRITPDMQNILGQYSDFLSARNSTGLDHTFYSLRAAQLPYTRLESLWQLGTGTEPAAGAASGDAVYQPDCQRGSGEGQTVLLRRSGG